MRLLLLLATTATLLSSPARSANILVWFSVDSKSHFIVVEPLVAALAARNHSLTVVAPMEVASLRNDAHNAHHNVIVMPYERIFEGFNSTDIFGGRPQEKKELFDFLIQAQDVIVAQPEVRELIRQKPRFDVAIVSTFCPDVGLYLARKVFDVPVVWFSSFQAWPSVNMALGNPMNPSVQPTNAVPFSRAMSFPERAYNAWQMAKLLFGFQTYFVPNMEKKIQEQLGLESRPDLNELISSGAFALLTEYPMLDGVRPVNSNTALVGGMHLREAGPLPRDIKKWLDDADEHGVILVSFGSVLTSSHLPEEKLRVLLTVFSRMKQRVLWKWETEHMPGKPDNVMLKKWLPQQDVLGHPNVRLFVTHAGMGSVSESLFHGVAIVTMPAFADQFANAAMANRLGFGKSVGWKDLTVHGLRSTIESALQNTTMTEVAKSYGDLMRDQMVHPLDRAVFHVEYVIRHKGAKHLRCASTSLSWVQFYLLDVISAGLLMTAMIAAVVCKTISLARRKSGVSVFAAVNGSVGEAKKNA